MATHDDRAVVMQPKARRPVRFEIAERSRDAIQARTRQLLLHHMKLESTVLYWGIEVDDALEILGQAEA